MQAEQTRHDILYAARRRFAEQGYAATSLKDIAHDAHVSVQTVYDSVGSKADLVRQLNDLIDGEAQIFEIAMAVPTETDPLVLARVPARITRRLIERCGDILRACLGGMHAEPGLRPVFEEGSRRHRQGAGFVAARLASLGALRDGVTVADAARTVAVLSEFRLAFVLLDDEGLTLDQLEDWITDTIARAVLRVP
jgi:AcrR family transcriptional regulator